MPAPQEFLELVDRFTEQYESYRAPTYNETQLRREFVDPFFKALGWDVDNRQGYTEAYKEVVHEDSIKIGGATKAPDYSFRIGGNRKFFVETKKPAVNIAHDVSPAFQLRRYAWSAKLPLSILTDFEELAVYDCRVRPHKNDKASTARTMLLKYTEYADRWDELAAVFSPEAIRKGSFDKYAVSKKKRGTAEVDDEFLKEIEEWRNELARNLALRNKQLSQREINFAVQKTIDRIIFLRICEDRSIEHYGQLQSLLNGDKAYARLCELFRKADDRYNSGLFHFTREKDRTEAPDEWTLSLAVDDRVLKDILRRLYPPESPYEFSVLGADILGQVYEQFLGKVIRLTKGHQARVEDKPEVKKAGGVYYTPTYIVDYIVRQTVGKLVEGKEPHEVAGRTKQTWKPSKRTRPLAVLDPACGSGSFLIGAYQFLLDWYRDWYVEHNPNKFKDRIYQTRQDEWRLTTAERKRILLDHIYGVDIDSQAVEVTKLSLLLKVLEGENQETLERQLRLFRERALPDLTANIKCGNSLIGPDFYEGRQLDLFDEEERLRINVFDWHAEFAEIFSGENPGFDAVIGNPPYVLLQDEFRDDSQLEYFRLKYNVASFKVDTYHLFMEKGIKLSAIGGWASMIVPANFLTNNHMDKVRRFLLSNTNIDHVLVVDEGVFAGISVDNAIYVVHRDINPESSINLIRSHIHQNKLELDKSESIERERISADKYALFTGSEGLGFTKLWEHCLSLSVSLKQIADVNFGKQLRNRKIFTEDVIFVPSEKAVPENYRPCYTGKDVERYSLEWNSLACLADREAKCGGCWDDEKHNAVNKLITRQIGATPVFAIDKHGYQCLNTVFMVNLNDDLYEPLYVLGLLNSKLLAALWLNRFYDRRRTFPKIKGTYLKELPIKKVDLKDEKDQEKRVYLISLVKDIVENHLHLESLKTTHERTALQRQIKATDQEIDKLVYELYGLCDEEIRIVEEATS